MIVQYKNYDDRVKHFIRNIGFINSLIPLPKTRKALNLLLEEMSVEKGFARHDGRDYFTHPIAVAQTAIDFGLVNTRINEQDYNGADTLITVCLLHDILEDVEWITSDYLIKEFDYETYILIDNVSKRKNEKIENYFDRVKSKNISALVKCLDRLNNVSTLADSTTKHRAKQLYETKFYYLPFFKEMRKIYVEDRPFYWQARTIMVSLLNEVERSLKYEDPKLYEEYKTMTNKTEKSELTLKDKLNNIYDEYKKEGIQSDLLEKIKEIANE